MPAKRRRIKGWLNFVKIRIWRGKDMMARCKVVDPMNWVD